MIECRYSYCTLFIGVMAISTWFSPRPAGPLDFPPQLMGGRSCEPPLTRLIHSFIATFILPTSCSFCQDVSNEAWFNMTLKSHIENLAYGKVKVKVITWSEKVMWHIDRFVSSFRTHLRCFYRFSLSQFICTSSTGYGKTQLQTKSIR